MDEFPLEQEPLAEEKALIEAQPLSVSVDDLLHRYLMEIRQYPFLSIEEEKRLTALSKSEDAPQAALQAITTLVLSHLRLAASIAMEYKYLPFPIMDMIQEGNMGLMQAIKKFDPGRDTRVATYATWWIRAYILRYIIQNWRLVRIGTTEGQRKLFFNLAKEKERLERAGYQVGPKLLADHLHVKEHEIIEVEQRLAFGQEVSTDQPIQGEDGSEMSYGDQIPSQEEGVDEQYEAAQFRALFQKKLTAFSETLKPRDQHILTDRILSETPRTLESFAIEYKISKERVRQLEENLIKRIKKYLRHEMQEVDSKSI